MKQRGELVIGTDASYPPFETTEGGKFDGFDIDLGPLFQTPEEAARQAVENDVHVVAMSSLAAGHKTLLPVLRAALQALGRDDIMIVCGGVIPAQDHEFLLAHGASAIFGPGTIIPQSSLRTMELLMERLELAPA